MKKKIIFAALLSCCLMFTSCGVLSSVISQIQSLANLANCSYALKNVSNLSIAGVNVKNITNGNITTADGLKLAAAILTKQVPLSMDLNIDVTNPTANPASLSTMDWIMEIEGTQMAQGTTTRAFSINPNATTAVPLTIQTDIYSLFQKEGTTALTNFVKSFTNDGTSSKVAVKIKPSLNVGGQTIKAPSFITLEKKTGTTTTSNSGSTGGATIGKTTLK